MIVQNENEDGLEIMDVIEQNKKGTGRHESEHKFVTKCRPNKLFELICELNDEQKKAVEEIGFGGLLHLKLIKEIPRGIVELLIKAFKPTSYMFRAKKIEFLLSKADVHDVFLLSRVGARVQKPMTGNCKVTADDELKVEWRRKFGLESKANPIKLNIVHDRLMSCNESGDDFKKLFVLYSMSIFLAPTTNYTLDLKLLRAVEDVANIKNSDWSLYVFEAVGREICW
ncbi:uncharacterized protein LOC141617493 [Silene latifolia]|uniref:uncharacterized protein LOC141617493 n=1 Tax=Silene latifolia TaxID=37657 RepID=UPI003D77234C